MASNEGLGKTIGSFGGGRAPVRLRRRQQMVLLLVMAALLTATWYIAAGLRRVYQEHRAADTVTMHRPGNSYSCAETQIDPAVFTHDFGNRTQPLALVAGALIDEQDKKVRILRVEAGQAVCIRVVVPPARPGNEAIGLDDKASAVVERHQPLAGHPGLWDSMMVDAVGASTGISVPVTMAAAPHMRMAERRAVHVYEGEVRLYDADVFAISGVVEFRDAQWNYEPPTPVPTRYAPEPIHVAAPTVIRVAVPLESRFHPRNYRALPACTRADEPGRWVAADAAAADGRDVIGLPTYRGRVWLPFECRLRELSNSEFLRCLDSERPHAPQRGSKTEAYTIHWFGDTGTRRALKKITSLGEWCSSNGAQYRQHCRCDDSGEIFPRFTGQNAVRDSLIELNDEDGGWSVRENGRMRRLAPFAPLARIYYHRWEGLSAYNGAADWRQALQPAALRAYPSADLVIVGLGTLDAALTPFLEYTQQLDDLVALLKANYPGRHVILRSPQYACCRLPAGAPLRRVQKDRNRLYGEYAARLFALRFGRLAHNWDVSQIAEALPLAVRREVSACAVSNVPADLVEVENHVLANSLCANVDPMPLYSGAAHRAADSARAGGASVQELP
ncbi:hypothetical protein LPJ72_003210 [Coemansia sp. Benny D160-2]|nr:hypothetical protein LPJ72_003210 [Coemansia sp. Benny D160-2]